MYNHILIATDGSKLAAKAVENGVELARNCGSKVTVVTVTEPFQSLGDKQHMFAGLPDDLRQQAMAYLFAAASDALEQARTAAAEAGIMCELKSIEHARPFEAIIAAAEQGGCDLIVMASHGRSGVSGFLLGSETTKVLTHTTIPTLVCR